MSNVADYEKPITDLKAKIEELKAYAAANNVDFSVEIEQLELRLSKLENEIHQNLTVWQRVQLARHVDRPTTLDYINFLITDWLELHGDRCFGDDAAIVAGVGKYKGTPVTIIGHQRGKDTKENILRNFGMPHPEGYRKALRLMKQAEKFNRPIITFVDTKGAYPGKAAEERGQSEAIARNLFEMAGLTVPVICIVIGEGGSGGALGIGVGNYMLMLEHSTYSVISPEGAAAILWKDATRAKEAAETMGITAQQLHKLGVVDEIISEVKGGAHKDVEQQAILIDAVLEKHLTKLMSLSKEELVEHRMNKYYSIGAHDNEVCQATK
ncbi:MAG: acetyl-CoA carboxylase carboxyltransferase subunit alpha [Bacilli bacterium]